MLLSSNMTEVEKMHKDAMYWISMIGYYQKDLQFAEKLLHAKIYKSKTPNLFERIQIYKEKIRDLNNILSDFLNEIGHHENEIRGLVDCNTISCDTIYHQKHKEAESGFKEKSIDFQSIKSEIFDYIPNAFL